MFFSSLLFLFEFLPIFLLVYFVMHRKLRNGVLFLFSLIFYAWGEPVYVAIMLFSTVVDYTHGLLVDYFKRNNKDRKAKICVASSIIINLSLLGVFKYSDFLLSNINSIFKWDIPLLNLALPIGISFYTFQTMSYTVDVYSGQAKAQKNIISFGAYVASFPQLIAGPIVQYKTIAEQLDSRKESFNQFSYGIMRFMSGLGKKVLLANNIGMVWNQIQSKNISDMPIVMAWLGIVCFAFQIYFDFSGYSDMAIGLGHMFGFKFLENFNYPYLSKSITEFWRRWHISLGSWFREYVYIPLGGNRHGLKKQIRNIAIVWLLTGIWHGASWNFLIWGAYFGVILVIEKMFLLKYLEKMPAVFSRVYTLLLVLISWVIFAFDNINNGLNYLKTMFGFNGSVFCNAETIYLLYNNIILIIILGFAATEIPKKAAMKIKAALMTKNQIMIILLQNAYVVGVFALSVAYLVNASYNPFLYLRF